MADPLVPWAAPHIQARLAEIESGFTGFSVDAVEAMVWERLAGHRHAVDDTGIMLYAGTNAMSPRAAAVHSAALGGRPSMGWPGEKRQTGLEHLEVIETLAQRLTAQAFRARYAEVRIQSATFANLAVYTAFTEPGDTIAALSPAAAGHMSHRAPGAPGVRGLNVVDLPYAPDDFDVDVAALPAFLDRHRPRLVVVGASVMLFPHRLSDIAAAAHDAGALVLYDGSHMAGLIAGGRFQDPLAEGADIFDGSTYKSFGGPPGAVICTNDPALAERVSAAVYPTLTANFDPSRLAPLAIAAAEALENGRSYADRCLANARALAAALHEQGFQVLAADRGFTRSHHIVVDARPLGGGRAAARRLAEAGVYLSAAGLAGAATAEPDSGLRIGTQEVTRRGLTEEDLRQVAAWMGDVLLRGADPPAIRAATALLRRRRAG
ncbi:aminotransferase class I/II-fold pyridoxal phosphate-dependent enzyme [Marinactinospora rubrisoli]|uniref:Aminotransferase class I/II-fold pyridoxal phosphate-dependent enzyme n=1 Tax=Marinactinospora rubrisoli TaxID=2715399 RepID=A0ABW2KG29_9ACTN